MFKIKIYLLKFILLILFHFNRNLYKCLLLEPDSIVEQQGWEVRWAKPIGASKVLERERYIREAVSNSGSQKTEIPRFKRGKKRSIKAITKMQEDEEVYLAQMKNLQSFVKEIFNATCDFDCVLDTTGYVGKVNVLVNS